MVGVQRDGDRVVLGDLACTYAAKASEPATRSLTVEPDEVLGAAEGHLDDAVGASLGEALECGGQCLRAGDVDCGVGETTGLGPVDHLVCTVPEWRRA